MKNEFCIFAFLTVVGIVTSTSPVVTVEQQALNVAATCITKQKLQESKIIPLLQPGATLPEDDEEFTNFFVCYYKNLGILSDSGDINHLLFTVMLNQLIEKKLTGADAKDKADEIGSNAVKNCKDIPKGSSTGLYAIKFRKCVFEELKKANAI